MNNKDSSKKKNGKNIKSSGHIAISKNLKRKKENMNNKDKSNNKDKKESGSNKKREKIKSAMKEVVIIINIDKSKKKDSRGNTIKSNMKNDRNKIHMTEENVLKIIDTHTIDKLVAKNTTEHMEVDQMILLMSSFESNKRCLSKK